jgi:hypothetical protein
MVKLRSMLLPLLCTTLLHAQSDVPLAMRAIEGDEEAIAGLRALGQPGVDALFEVRSAVPEESFRTVVDRVCRQRDCAWSRLYWHTDLAEAKRAARAMERPILSLRLLGNLDEELSCANSRYFRTLLYSNTAVSNHLRETYVLHWESVRPVPVVTIEMGDGRRMVRTLTGNSIHYLLDSEGRAFDSLPGLYSPQAFIRGLQKGLANAKRPPAAIPIGGRGSTPSRSLAAERAAALAVTKSLAEAPTLNAIALDVRDTQIVPTIESRLGGEGMFDPNSIDLISTKRAGAAGSLDDVLANLRDAVTADTMQNEELLRPRIRARIDGERARTGVFPAVGTLNEWVYREVFLTPPDDVWMGLTSRSAFTALDGEGLFEPNVAAKLPAR